MKDVIIYWACKVEERKVVLSTWYITVPEQADDVWVPQPRIENRYGLEKSSVTSMTSYHENR
jgi:hypothetical protein